MELLQHEEGILTAIDSMVADKSIDPVFLRGSLEDIVKNVQEAIDSLDE